MDIIVLVLVAIGVLTWSLIIFKRKYDLYKKSEKVKGKILEFRKYEEVIVETWDYKKKVTIYRPIIEICIDGINKTFHYEEEISKKKYENRDEIDILYNKEGDNIYIDSKIEFFKFPILLLILSIVFLGVIVILYLFKY
ncbi:hypothetical protein [uncultured Clostridium sp.]|uniref:hypothetical protein n=1 Tax=uncultured Clostridium sp. TaxID=59620 RepID=UPI00262487B4|nr:hypothetical protein [uncultured Clostridium sp.]